MGLEVKENTINSSQDMWKSAGAYEAYVGRWSRLVAAQFVDWLDTPPGARWLDVGCGTGALSKRILETRSPLAVVGLDRSADYVAWAAADLDDSRFEVEVGDALDLPDGPFDAIVSGLVLNFLPDPGAVLAGARRAAPAGTVGVYVWDYADRMEFMRYFWDSAAAVDPAAADLAEGTRFPICKPEALAWLWRDVGFTDVVTRAIDIPTAFADFDDFWSPFLGGAGQAPAYVSGLEPAHRDELREHLRRSLPIADDGSVSLIARAWAVRGRA